MDHAIGNEALALSALQRAWPQIVEESRQFLGGELSYQALVYHTLRIAGVPIRQLGMNVKQWISDPVSSLFRELDLRKHEGFRGGFEPIPDVVIFRPEVNGDWRRRNNVETLANILVAIEVKASERAGKRLTAGEVSCDILKLAAHREEVQYRGANMRPVMMVIDVAPELSERMTSHALSKAQQAAEDCGVALLYVSQDAEFFLV